MDEQESIEHPPIPYNSTYDQEDLAQMSVDDIIRSTMARRNQGTFNRSSPLKYTPKRPENVPQFNRSVEKENLYESPEEDPPEPYPIFASQQDLHNMNKSYDERDFNKNDLIERKVEEVIRRFIGNSNLSSIRGSRENSLPRNLNQEYFNSPFQQNQGFYNTYSMQNQTPPQMPNQMMFNSLPEMSNNIDLMKKQIEDLVKICIISANFFNRKRGRDDVAQNET